MIFCIFDFAMRPISKYRGEKYKEIAYFSTYIPHIKGRYIEPFLVVGQYIFFLNLTMQLLMT